jgi:hypothetical protein
MTPYDEENQAQSKARCNILHNEMVRAEYEGRPVNLPLESNSWPELEDFRYIIEKVNLNAQLLELTGKRSFHP